MPVSCSAYGCTNRQNTASGIHFYRFPFSRNSVLKQWIHAVRRKNFKPTSASRICSVHFQDSDFVQNSTLVLKKLKLDAVPSNFPSFSGHLKLKAKTHVDQTSHQCNVSIAADDVFNTSNIGIGATQVQVNESLSSYESDCSPIAIMKVPDTHEVSLDGLSAITSTKVDTKFVNASTITDPKKIENRSTQTLDSAVPHTLKMVKEENRILKQRVKRQCIRIQNLQDLMKTLGSKH